MKLLKSHNRTAADFCVSITCYIHCEGVGTNLFVLSKYPLTLQMSLDSRFVYLCKRIDIFLKVSWYGQAYGTIVDREDVGD